MNREQPAVVITGGAGDLARALVVELTDNGCKVEAPSHKMLDVTQPEVVMDYFKHRHVDLLICNAGITCDKPLARMSEDNWDRVWNTNYEGSRFAAKTAIEAMKARGGGHVVFISSFSALHPPIGQASYAASKAALNGLVSDFAVRYGADNIRINAVLPGFMETKMTEAVTDERKQQVISHHALGRLNGPQETARFIRFLHLDMPHTSGQLFQLDSRLASW